jgi:hypothetical protein
MKISLLFPYFGMSESRTQEKDDKANTFPVGDPERRNLFSDFAHALCRRRISKLILRNHVRFEVIKAVTMKMQSSGMLCRVALVRTDVPEELRVSIIKVTRIGELGTTLAVTSVFGYLPIPALLEYRDDKTGLGSHDSIPGAIIGCDS